MSSILSARNSVEKMKEVFVPQPVLRKNLSRIFKIHLRLPKNRSGRGRGKTGKNGKFFRKVVFCVVSGIPDPPPPPPLVKCRTPGGVRNLIWVVDLDAISGPFRFA
jgi:hypothetical protein